MARTYVDDNFGHWDEMDDPENVAYYQQLQRTNVRKKCVDCDRWVKIQPQYECCDPCATQRERGGGY